MDIRGRGLYYASRELSTFIESVEVYVFVFVSLGVRKVINKRVHHDSSTVRQFVSVSINFTSRTCTISTSSTDPYRNGTRFCYMYYR